MFVVEAEVAKQILGKCLPPYYMSISPCQPPYHLAIFALLTCLRYYFRSPSRSWADMAQMPMAI
eukprot:1161215-Pelagomonas_calceolata.AAC.5